MTNAECDVLLPNLESVRIPEEDDPPGIYVVSGKYRSLVRLCRAMSLPAGLLSDDPRGDEQSDGGSRERHIAVENVHRK